MHSSCKQLHLDAEYGLATATIFKSLAVVKQVKIHRYLYLFVHFSGRMMRRVAKRFLYCLACR